MTLVNIRKKIWIFISIFARISIFEHFRGDWAYAEPIFCWEVSKNFDY